MCGFHSLYFKLDNFYQRCNVLALCLCCVVFIGNFKTSLTLKSSLPDILVQHASCNVNLDFPAGS